MRRSGGPASVDIAKLFANQRHHVRGQLARMLPASEVDDVLQEVFVKAARAAHGFRGTARVETWLHRIAERTALDHLRSRRHHKQKRTVPLASGCGDRPCDPGRECAAEPPPVPAEAPGRMVAAEMHGCIREYVGQLSPEHARVITLKDIEGLTNPEIAARLGLDPRRLHGFNALARYRKHTDLFDIDSVPEPERIAIAEDVAQWVVENLAAHPAATAAPDTESSCPGQPAMSPAGSRGATEPCGRRADE